MKRKLLSLAVALLCSVSTWADTSLLKTDDGWQKITSFPATLSDYYFVFVDKNNDLMLSYGTGANQGSNYKTMYYTTSQNPTKTANRGFMWEISTNSDGYSIKNVTEETYYIQTEYNAGWYCHTHDNGGGDAGWYKWKIVYGDETSLWTIENGSFANNFVGPWEAAIFSNGSEVAGNKMASGEIGHFYIYAIRKNDLDVVLPAITYLESRTDNSASIAAMRTKLSNREYATNATTDAILNEYKALEISALSSASAADYTSVLINPSFETGDMIGWTTINQNNVVDPTTLSDCNVKPVASYPLSNSDGDYIMNYYGWSWSWNGTINGIQQTIPELPAGNYRVEAVLGGWNNWDMVLIVNNESQTKTMTADNTGVSFSVDISLVSATNLTITARTLHTGNNAWEACFLKADNFRLYNLDHYYDALNAAIAAAEAKTLGFEEGEYAPYNNVAAITALNAAKAVNQNNYDISWSELETIVSNLTSATWTQNVESMNAIYNPTFSLSTNNLTALGWSSNDGTVIGNESGDYHSRAMVGDDRLAALNGTKSALYLRYDGTNSTVNSIYNYGTVTGYIMPLKAGTIYRVKADAAVWSTDNTQWYKDLRVAILNSSSVEIGGQTLRTPNSSMGANSTDKISYDFLFCPSADGNYTLTVDNMAESSTGIVISNFELKKAASQTLTLPSATQYAAGTYPAVELGRTFTTTNWATVCVPFVFDKSNFEVKELSDITVTGDHISIKLDDASSIVAGKPYLVKANAADAKIAATDVAMPGASVQESSITKDPYTVSFVGTYEGESLTSANSNAWVVSQNQLWNVNSNVTVGAYRAYFTVTGTSVKALVFGDEETGINNLNVDDDLNKNEAIYNLAGQRVQKAVKGLYIKNGKKVVIK